MKEGLDWWDRLCIHSEVSEKVMDSGGVIFRVQVRRELVGVLVDEGDIAVCHELAGIVVLDVVVPRLAGYAGGCCDVDGRLIVGKDGGGASLREAHRGEELAEPHDLLEAGREPYVLRRAGAERHRRLLVALG